MSIAAWSINGPTLTPSSVPRPTVRSPILAANRAENSSATDSCTMNRLAAVHASPMLRILASIAPSTAASRSASPKTRNGAFPPSSIEIFSTCSADCLINPWPTLVDPVKVSFRSRGSAMIGADTLPEDDVVITFTTPSGNPASARMPARASVVSGVNAAGLITTVHPAANAGPILRVPIASGKFHGVIAYTGPTGCFIVSNRVPPDGATEYRPEIRTASSENQRKNSAP